MKRGDYVIVGKQLSKHYQKFTNHNNEHERAVTGDIGRVTVFDEFDSLPYEVYFPRTDQRLSFIRKELTLAKEGTKEMYELIAVAYGRKIPKSWFPSERKKKREGKS